MPHLVEELQEKAEDAMAAMRAAAIRARELHARAELMRHMRMTAAKVQHAPDPVAALVDEWLFAWKLDRSFPYVGAMEALTRAFLAYVRDRSDAADQAVRIACAEVESGFVETGIELPDRMAWRSMCAHGWWAQVKPAPAGLGRPDRPWPARPFWEEGCLPECLGE